MKRGLMTTLIYGLTTVVILIRVDKLVSIYGVTVEAISFRVWRRRFSIHNCSGPDYGCGISNQGKFEQLTFVTDRMVVARTWIERNTGQFWVSAIHKNIGN